MELVDNPLAGNRRGRVLLPAFGIRPLQIHRHAPLPVQPAGFRPGVGGTDTLLVPFYGKVIVHAVQFLFCAPAPHAFFFPFHGHLPKGPAAVPSPVQVQGYFV